MIKFVGWVIDRLFLVLGALLGSQVPEFMQQYTQRLGGHVDELAHLLSMMKQSAALSNKSLDLYIHKFLINSDPDFVRQGEFMKSILLRWENLNTSLYAILESPFWAKPFVFFTHMDRDIFATTIKAYHPGFALTVEGVCYTALGMVMTCGLYRITINLFDKKSSSAVLSSSPKGT